MLHVGMLYHFGRLFDPPRPMTHAKLAQIFRKPTTTVQSILRRYARETSRQS
jgi:hypothetical protein